MQYLLHLPLCVGNNPQYSLKVNCTDQAGGTVWILLSRHITTKVSNTLYPLPFRHVYVAVLGRNRTLSRCIFCCVTGFKRCSADLPLRAELIRYVDLSGIHTTSEFAARMSPALNASFALQHFERHNVVKICNRCCLFSTQDYHIYG